MNNAIDYMATARRQAQDDWHQMQVDSDAAWDAQREWLVETLASGGTIYLNNKPLLTIDDLEIEIADRRELFGLVRAGIEVCARDETGAGALLAQAAKGAAKRLIWSQEVALREAFEAPADESFFNHIGGVA